MGIFDGLSGLHSARAGTRGVARAVVLACLFACAPLLMAAEVVGEVIFAIGDAKISGDGGSRAAKKGDKIAVGQMLSAGESGHIHVRFVDKAFVSVRPRSTLRIDTYTYSAEKPAASFVKFTLETGTARLITGAAGHAAKENFRLNTPVAAIGVRGTDFVVNTTAETTRVSVNEGAIAMSPLTGDCRADGFGPCQSNLVRQLSSATANAYLELRSRSAAPVLQSTDGDAPNKLVPPRPEEPRAAVPDKSLKTGSSSSEAVNEVVASALQRVATPVAAAPVTPPVAVVVATPPSAKVWWGRWADYAQPAAPGSILSVMAPDREISVSNLVFGLFVEKNRSVELPATGVVGFTLADSEAYRKVGTTLTHASLSDATLTMDFGKRGFDTALIWKQGAQSVSINASGSINFQGILVSDASRSNAEVVGAISAANSQAGYLFAKPIDATSTAIGATRWVR